MKFKRHVELTDDEIDELEANRIKKLDEAGIDEGEVLESAKKHSNMWTGYFQENLVRGKADMEFLLRDQWTAVEKGEFTRTFKPAMTFNKLYPIVKMVGAQQRRNRPNIAVKSINGKATQQQITLRADLTRSIAYHSQNDIIYQRCFNNGLRFGWGAFQVCLEYENSKSFNQVIRYDLISDMRRAGWDPNAIMPHKGDGNFCYRDYTLTRDEFDAEYPFAINPVSYASDSRYQLDIPWELKDTIVIRDYFRKEWFPFMTYQLSDGRSVDENEWQEILEENERKLSLVTGDSPADNIILKEIPKIVRERQSEDYIIMHYRLIKDRIVEFTQWPSKHLPIIFVDGDSDYIDSLQFTRSLIRDAKDAQRVVNYTGCEIVAEIKNRRREQWLATPENIEGRELMWRNAELQMGALIAKPDTKTGMMPTKVAPSEVPQGLFVQYQQATKDIMEITGVFEAAMGAQGNERSGVAIDKRNINSSDAAYVYFDNLAIAQIQGGRVVLDLLPVIYPEERSVVVSKPNGESQSITLNQEMPDGTFQNKIDNGDYDIEIDAGPSFAIQKEQSIEILSGLAKEDPRVMPLVIDIIAKNLDIEDGKLVSDRLKSLVPPEVLAKENGQPPPPKQPNPQEMMAAQQMKLAEAELKEKEQELMLRKETHELEFQIAKKKAILEELKIKAGLYKDHIDQVKDLHKTDLDYTAKMANVLKDMHKNI